VRSFTVGTAFTCPPAAPDGTATAAATPRVWREPASGCAGVSGSGNGSSCLLPQGPACVDLALTQDLDLTLACFQRAAEGADVCVVDGCLAVLDGARLRRRSQCSGGSGSGAAASAADPRPAAGCSTAEVARALRLPLILVVDVSALRSPASVAALLQGYSTFGGGLEIAGLVLNRAGDDELEEMRQGLADAGVRTPIVATLPDLTGLAAESSGGNGWHAEQQLHSGSSIAEAGWGGSSPLASFGRGSGHAHSHQQQQVEALAKAHLCCDLDALLGIARGARVPQPAAPLPPPARSFKVAIGVAYDQAFYKYFQQ